MRFEGEQDLLAACQDFLPADAVTFDTFMLRVKGAIAPRRDGHLPGGRRAIPPPPARAAGARTGRAGYHDTPVYDYDKLAAGNVVAGPAIIDSDSTTYVLPANASLTVDAYRNGVIALGGDGARTAGERGTL